MVICFHFILSKVQFPENSRFLKFLAFFWSIGASQKSEKEQSGIPIPSAVAIVQSLHVAQVLVKSLDEKTMTNLIISEHSPGNIWSGISDHLTFLRLMLYIHAF